jgi:hypothetical protein
MKECENKITRKKFLETAAVTATAVALGSAFKPTLRAFAKSSKAPPNDGDGQWRRPMDIFYLSGLHLMVFRPGLCG